MSNLITELRARVAERVQDERELHFPTFERFLDLPRELRDVVYIHLLEGCGDSEYDYVARATIHFSLITPDCECDPDTETEEENKNYSRPPKERKLSFVHTEILRSCQQIYGEALPLLYSRTGLCCICTRIARGFIVPGTYTISIMKSVAPSV